MKEKPRLDYSRIGVCFLMFFTGCFVTLFILLVSVSCPPLLKPLKSTFPRRVEPSPQTNVPQSVYLLAINPTLLFYLPLHYELLRAILEASQCSVCRFTSYRSSWITYWINANKRFICSWSLLRGVERTVIRGWHVGEGPVINWIIGYDRGSWSLGAYRNGENKMGWERKPRKIVIRVK